MARTTVLLVLIAISLLAPTACGSGDYTVVDACVDVEEWLELIDEGQMDAADDVADRLASSMPKVGTDDEVYDKIRAGLIAWVGVQADVEGMDDDWVETMSWVGARCSNEGVEVLPPDT